ncbi:unnamed protein product, partial [Ectocarpus fasciculatus]
MRRAEQERVAIAETQIKGLEKDLDAAARREERLRAELDKMGAAAEAGQREAPTFNMEAPEEASGTTSNFEDIGLTGYKKMAAHTRPVIGSIKPCSDHSVMVTVDNCGNCFQSSWFVVVMLWAVQRPRRVEDLLSRLLQGYDQGGALLQVPTRYQ